MEITKIAKLVPSNPNGVLVKIKESAEGKYKKEDKTYEVFDTTLAYCNSDDIENWKEEILSESQTFEDWLSEKGYVLIEEEEVLTEEK